MIRRLRAAFACVLACAAAPVETSLADSFPVPVFDVPAAVETISVGGVGDAADDPEIWRNAADPAQSRIFATDKKAGLYVLDLKGQQVGYFGVGKLNNVDLRNSWEVSGKKNVLIAASDRTKVGISFFMLDPETLAVSHLANSFVAADVADAYGQCMYRSRKDQALYAIVTGKGGEVRQFQLTPREGGEVEAKLVRSFEVGSIAEGCVADDRTGALYIAEEMKGIWRYGAEPENGSERTMIAAVDGSQMVADIEGLSLAADGESDGYLVASIQGNSTFALFQLPGEKPAARFRITENTVAGIDAVTGTDGLAVAIGDFGPEFPQGVLVVQDDENAGGSAQNFKIVSWAAVLAILPKE